MLLCEVDSSAFGDSADDGSSVAAEQAEAAGEAAAEAAAVAEPAAEVQAAAEPVVEADDMKEGAAKPAAGDDFIAAASFEGAKPGFAFKLGKHGLGYYADPLGSGGGGSPAGSAAAGGAAASAVGASDSTAALTPPATEAEPAEADGPPMPRAAPAAGPLPPGPRHHWGQALQYLDRAVQVAPGRKLALLARREDGRLRFALRQGVGEPVGRAPWKIEWGGGASIENPHFQRVHYCELLVSRGLVQLVWLLWSGLAQLGRGDGTGTCSCICHSRFGRVSGPPA